MGDEIRSDAKLKNLTAEQLEELWEMRYPVDEDAEKLPYVRIASEELPRMVGYTVSLSTLSEFYSWLKQKKETEDAIERAEQAKLQYLEENPEATPEALMALGQMVFTNKTLQQGNLNGYVKLAALMERRKAREFNERKFQEAIKSKLDAGLDALFEEIKGNKKAEAIFAQLKEVVAGS